jgi:hypothetical protein
MPLQFSVLPGPFAICRLESQAPRPGIPVGVFSSVTTTPSETSVVCEETFAPAGALMDGGWCALEVLGPLDLASTGILASVAIALAEAGIAIFAVSTYDTDYVLVKRAALEDAVRALRAEGHIVNV